MTDLDAAIRAKVAGFTDDGCTYFTSAEARVIAADLVAHADALDELTGKSTGA